jgi:predicted nucleic acid-binding protein
MIYFDTSFLLPVVLREPTSNRIEEVLLSALGADYSISRWTLVEVASALARHVRMGTFTGTVARAMEAEFDEMIAESFSVLTPGADDFALAQRYLRDHQSGLRAGDALHLAIAANNRADAVYSLDKTLTRAGLHLGIRVRAAALQR